MASPAGPIEVLNMRLKGYGADSAFPVVGDVTFSAFWGLGLWG